MPRPPDVYWDESRRGWTTSAIGEVRTDRNGKAYRLKVTNRAIPRHDRKAAEAWLADGLEKEREAASRRSGPQPQPATEPPLAAALGADAKLDGLIRSVLTLLESWLRRELARGDMAGTATTKPSPTQDGALTIDEAAAELGVSPWQVIWWSMKGHLAVFLPPETVKDEDPDVPAGCRIERHVWRAFLDAHTIIGPPGPAGDGPARPDRPGPRLCGTDGISRLRRKKKGPPRSE